MCDCCNAEGRDFTKRCGEKARVRSARLYKVYVGRVASVKLCDIELFRGGESRFLASNIRFAQNLVMNQSSGGGGFFD